MVVKRRNISQRTRGRRASQVPKSAYFPFGGGLDLVTPNIEMKPGRVLGSVNYEIGISEGYRRIDGRERFDGQAKPSDASYWIVDFDTGDTEIVAGDTVVGGTSAAEGVAVVDGVLESGTYGGGDASGYVVLYGLTAAVQDGEDLEVASAKVAEATSVSLERNADTIALDQTYYRAAIEATRDSILVVPGSGAMRGIWTFDGTKYAFRDNAGATAVDMYKSTTAGWVKCELGYTLYFNTGSVAFTVGSVLSGASASGTVKKVVVQTGTFAGGDAEGFVVLYSTASTPFTDTEAITDAAGGAAVADGAGSANTFSAGGHFEFRNHNYGGHTSTRKMYGVNGLDKAFVWDGDTFVPIDTGMVDDSPNHIAAHLDYLFLSFSGGSAQFSAIGDPTKWTVVLGAGELAVGDEIVSMTSIPGDTLVIQSRNSIRTIDGTVSTDWTLSTYSSNSGAIEWTVQYLQDLIYLDDRGLTSLKRVDVYGNFSDNTISKEVQARLDSKKTQVVSSVICRSKNQYIIYFSNNTGLQCTFKGGKLVGFMDLDYGNVVRCAVSGEDSSGNEELFYGSDDGYIYELNKGTSFDGDPVSAFLRMAYHHIGSPFNWKKFLKVYLELGPGAQPDMELEVSASLSYSDPNIPTGVPIDLEIAGGGGFWNSANWNEFYWSGQAIGTAEWYMEGDGYNISLLINSEATYEVPHTLHGATIHYYLMGMKR